METESSQGARESEMERVFRLIEGKLKHVMNSVDQKLENSVDQRLDSLKRTLRMEQD